MCSKQIARNYDFKVMHLVISLQTGGLERFVINLISANQRIARQIVVCLETEGELASECRTDVLALNMLPGLHLGKCFDIARIVREEKIDIIHTHNEKAQLYGGITGLLARVPAVHTKHGRNLNDWRTRLRNRISAALCRQVTAVSRNAAEECVNVEKIPQTKVSTILNGVDTTVFEPGDDSTNLKKSLGIRSDQIVIGIVARLAPIKDHATLLRACHLLAEADCAYKLLIVGDGECRGQLEESALALGISDNVFFAGMRVNISDLMKVMDIFVLSSLSEGVSLTLLEAMATGLPVVATAVGGNPEVVVDGETGILVPPERPDLIAEKLLQLINDFDMRQNFGANGRQRVIDHFSLSRSADKYVELYSEVLGL